MSGRRGHVRFGVNPSPEGVLRVLREVVVHRLGDGEVIVSSPQPGVVEERLTLDVPDGQRTRSMRVQVAESRPVIVDGAVRHHVRLRVLEILHRAGADLEHDLPGGHPVHV